MPFKSDKQRKWMHANEPEMAKKWEKEEALKEKLRKVIRQEIKSINEAQFFRAKQMVLLPDKKMYFDPMNDNLWLMGPYGGPDLDDDPIEPRDRDYKKIIRKLSSKDKSVLKKAMRTRKRRKEATTSVSVPGYLTPDAFKKSTQKAIDVDDEDDEKSESINERKLSSHQKKAILIAIEMSGNMTGAVKKIEKIKRGLSNDKKVKAALRVANESMAAPFRRRKSRGLGRPMKVGLSEGKSKPSKGDYVKTMIGVIAKIEKVRGTIAYMKLQDRKSKGYWINDLKNLKSTDKMEKGKSLWTESIDELQMAPFSSQEARSHINSDIKDMSKLLGKTSQQVIKIMMNGVRKGKYTAMDISRGIKEGPARRTHYGEMDFIQELWHKVRDGFRRYSKDRKLS